MDGGETDWTPEAVLLRLEGACGTDAAASAHLFLSGDVPADEVAQRVRRAVAEVAPEDSQAVALGPVSKLARSVGIRAPVRVLRSLMSRDEFVSILPGDLDDMLIRPVDKRPA